jgi:release factor glutamine methyltransferase
VDGIATALAATLRAAGCVFAEDEARLLLEAATGSVGLDELVARRVAGEPLEHVLGWVEFAGLWVSLGPGVFVPRRRSEVLVTEAAALAARARWRRPVIVDLCCGCGAVGAALAARLPSARVHSTDSDPRAVRWAERNLPAARGWVHQGDLYQPLPAALRASVHLIVAVAPYVPTGAIPLLPPEARDHEPPLALDGGADGLALVRRVIAEASDWLAREGHLVVEIGHPQIEDVTVALRGAGLTPRIVISQEPDAVVVIGSRNDN